MDWARKAWVLGGGWVMGGVLLFGGGCDASAGSRDGGVRLDGSSASYVPPVAPGRFTIGLAPGSCVAGSCAYFHVQIDQDGVVDFVGRRCTARPGVFRKQVAKEHALAFYRSLTRTQYWSLPDDISRESKACVEPSTDQGTALWKVSVDGHEKPLVRYFGCKASPALAEVDALESELVRVTEVESWVTAGPRSCPLFAPMAPALDASSYRISRAGVTLGVLSLPNLFQWELRDCRNALLGTGQPIIEPQSWVLVDGADKKLTFVDGTQVGSIVIERQGNGAATARGLRATDEVELGLTPATGC